MRAVSTRSNARLRRYRTWCGRPEAELVELLGAEPFGDRTFAEALGPDHPYLRWMAYALHRHDPRFIDAIVDDATRTYARLSDTATWLRAVRGPVRYLRADPGVLALSTDADEQLVRTNALDGAGIIARGIGHGLQNFAPEYVAEILRSLMKAGHTTRWRRQRRREA